MNYTAILVNGPYEPIDHSVDINNLNFFYRLYLDQNSKFRKWYNKQNFQKININNIRTIITKYYDHSVTKYLDNLSNVVKLLTPEPKKESSWWNTFMSSFAQPTVTVQAGGLDEIDILIFIYSVIIYLFPNIKHQTLIGGNGENIDIIDLSGSKKYDRLVFKIIFVDQEMILKLCPNKEYFDYENKIYQELNGDNNKFKDNIVKSFGAGRVKFERHNDINFKIKLNNIDTEFKFNIKPYKNKIGELLLMKNDEIFTEDLDDYIDKRNSFIRYLNNEVYIHEAQNNNIDDLLKIFQSNIGPNKLFKSDNLRVVFESLLPENEKDIFKPDYKNSFISFFENILYNYEDNNLLYNFTEFNNMFEPLKSSGIYDISLVQKGISPNYDEINTLILNIIKTLCYLNSTFGFIHYDLHSQNLLVGISEDPNVGGYLFKLFDFDLSRTDANQNTEYFRRVNSDLKLNNVKLNGLYFDIFRFITYFPETQNNKDLSELVRKMNIIELNGFSSKKFHTYVATQIKAMADKHELDSFLKNVCNEQKDSKIFSGGYKKIKKHYRFITYK